MQEKDMLGMEQDTYEYDEVRGYLVFSVSKVVLETEGDEPVEGYFELEIDSTDVDVTFKESITLSLANDNTVDDLQIVGYSLNGGSIVYFNNGPTTITTNHTLNEQNTVNTYTIYVKWLEGNGETMDNEDDTAASSDGVAKVSVSINFLQTITSPSSSSTPEPEPSSQP